MGKKLCLFLFCQTEKMLSHLRGKGVEESVVAMQNEGQRERRCWCYQLRKIMTHVDEEEEHLAP